MKKIISVIGARPQFIKSSAISNFINNSENFQEIIINTGQHFERSMSDVFFEELGIAKPKYNLGINGLTHGAMTGRMIEKIEEVLLKERPDYVLVYGDTNSTLAGAIAGRKLNIKIIHIEAGLRSYNNFMPEEINRIITDRISDYLFCPTTVSYNNLIKEGFNNFNVCFEKVGDVMYDVYKNNINKISNVSLNVPEKYALCTIHRAENTDSLQNLSFFVDHLNKFASNIKVIIPAHPRLLNFLKIHKLEFSQNIILLAPVSYIEMLFLIKNSEVVITDSGGLQKDAFFAGKLCITLRKETEWSELTHHKFNSLFNIDSNTDLESLYLSNISSNLNFNIDLYGGGNAAELIFDHINLN